MLRGTLAFLFLVAFAVAANEVRQHLLRRGIRAPSLEGLTFLAVGFALSDRALGVLPADLLESLRMVIMLGLTWVGLVFGLQIDLRVMRRLRPWHRRIGLLLPILSGLLVCAGCVMAGLSIRLGLALGSIAMVSSPIALETLLRVRPPRDRSALRLLKLVMAFSGIPAVICFAVASSLSQPEGAAGTLAWWQVLVSTLALGMLTGFVVIVLVRGFTDRIQLLTILIGTMSILAGAAAVLQVSPLPAAAVAGTVIMNRAVFPHRLLKVAHSFEAPVVVALLVLVGASWSGVHFSWHIFAIMVAVRLCGEVMGGSLLKATARRHKVQVPMPLIGFGLLAQGELAMGLLVALVAVPTGILGLFEAVVAAMVVNQLVGLWWLRRFMFRPVQELGGGP